MPIVSLIIGAVVAAATTGATLGAAKKQSDQNVKIAQDKAEWDAKLKLVSVGPDGANAIKAYQ